MAKDFKEWQLYITLENGALIRYEIVCWRCDLESRLRELMKTGHLHYIGNSMVLSRIRDIKVERDDPGDLYAFDVY